MSLVLPLPFVLIAISPGLHTVSLFQITHPLSIVFSSTYIVVYSMSLFVPTYPVSFVNAPININVTSLPMEFIVLPIPFVKCAVSIVHDTISISHSIFTPMPLILFAICTSLLVLEDTYEH